MTEREWGAGTPSIETLVDVALRIVDEHGFDALSTQRLAKELGVHRPNIYRRVANLEELHRHMVERIFDEAGVPDASVTEWRGQLIDAAVRIWTAWSAYPLAAPLLRTGMPSKPVMAYLDFVFSVFLLGGFSDRDAEHAAQAYITYVFGAIAMRGITHGSQRITLDEELAESYPGVAEAQARIAAWEERLVDPLLPAREGLAVVLDGIAARRLPD